MPAPRRSDIRFDSRRPATTLVIVIARMVIMKMVMMMMPKAMMMMMFLLGRCLLVFIVHLHPFLLLKTRPVGLHLRRSETLREGMLSSTSLVWFRTHNYPPSLLPPQKSLIIPTHHSERGPWAELCHLLVTARWWSSGQHWRDSEKKRVLKTQVYCRFTCNLSRLAPPATLPGSPASPQRVEATWMDVEIGKLARWGW